MTIQYGLDRSHLHFGWNSELPPALKVKPGEAIELDLVDASGGQINKGSTASDISRLSFDRINPVTGPIFVEGAHPSDTLCVEILGFQGSGWGWTAIIPGFGLLADEFPDPCMVISGYDETGVDYIPGIRLPYRPFPGTIGVAPVGRGVQPVVFPRSCGGNMDIKNLVRGAKLFLPVQVEGALFSAGDGHAAQGDGEVCGTGVETDLKLIVRFGLLKSPVRGPAFEYPEPPAGPSRTILATTGIGPDLKAAARDAVRYMIDHLGREYGLEPALAYTLCSVAGDLRISEIVDAPNWIVTMHMDKSIFV